MLSLLVAVGTTSYAAGLARGSVGTAQLREGAVTTPKIREGAVTGAKVRDGSIRRADLADTVAAAPVTHVRRSLALNESGVVLAAVNGIELVASCNAEGANGALAVLTIKAAPDDAPSNPLTSSLTLVRRDQGTSEATVSTSGAGGPFSSAQLLGYAASYGVGSTTASGVLQYLDLDPVRADLAATGVGATGESRGCRFRALIVPIP